MKVRSVSSVLMAAVVVLGFASNSQAAPRVAGPALDFKGDYTLYPNGEGVPTTTTWITIWGSPYESPSWGAPATIHRFPPFPQVAAPWGFKINTFNDFISIDNPHIWDGGGNSSTARGAAAAYISYDDESLPATTMIMTTIYGQDLDPDTPGSLLIGGYDIEEVFPQLSGEHIIGPSGTTYSASSRQLLPISDLSALLGPDADLSIFTGDPSASVWVFQTSLPFGELAVPEPSTALLAVGLVAMAGIAVRRRR